MIIRANVFIVSILHPESSGDCSKLNETQSLIQMSGMNIAFHNGIELEHTETKILSVFQTVKHQFFTDMLSPACGGYRITGIADMSASPYIIRMQDIQSDNLSVILRYTSITLGSEECFAGFFRQA